MFAKRFKTSLLPLFAGFLLLFHLVLAGPAAASAERRTNRMSLQHRRSKAEPFFMHGIGRSIR